MKFLLDTNVFIPLEPTSTFDVEISTEPTTKLSQVATEQGHQLYIHPLLFNEISEDQDADRAKLRKILARKYPALIDPPCPPPELVAVIGEPEKGTNDWIDNQLLGALYLNTVDFLITEDKGIHKKAKRVGLSDRTVSIQEAISIIIDFSDKSSAPPPLVESTVAYSLNFNDPIFNSLREDYPGFDNWSKKCSLEHRQSWLVYGQSNRIGGVCIVKKEKFPPPGCYGKVLKLCTFKVSDNFNGFRFGELLLKAVFEFGWKNHFDWIYFTVFKKHQRLIQFFEDFGFNALSIQSELGELIFAKRMQPDSTSMAVMSPLDYNIQFGPCHIHPKTPNWFIVPIKQKYSNILFPEAVDQTLLFPNKAPFGNSIRKAYLCKSPKRTIPSGALLLFYRTGRANGLVSIGVTESSNRASDPVEIARYVGKRTVYSLDEIEEMCSSDSTVLSILFRQAKTYTKPISRKALESGSVFKRPPQSMMEISEKGKAWLKKKLEM